jgi:hypothetical protein
MWTVLRWAEVVADLAVPAAMLLGLYVLGGVSAQPPVGTPVVIPAQSTYFEEAEMTSADPRPLAGIPVAPAVGGYLDDEAPEREPDPREVRHTVPPVDDEGNLIDDADTNDVAADNR